MARRPVPICLISSGMSKRALHLLSHNSSFLYPESTYVGAGASSWFSNFSCSSIGVSPQTLGQQPMVRRKKNDDHGLAVSTASDCRQHLPSTSAYTERPGGTVVALARRAWLVLGRQRRLQTRHWQAKAGQLCVLSCGPVCGLN